MVDARNNLRIRRTDILEAARLEFAATGYAGARIERIAAAAKVNKQLLFHYFGSKEGLFTAALAAQLEQIDTRAHGNDSPVAQLRQWLRDLIVAVRAVPGVAGFVADARSNPDFPPAAHALLSAWRERLLARLAAAVRDGQRRGYFRDDVDPAGVAGVALAAVIGVVAVDAAPGAPAFEEYLPRLMVEHCAWR